MAEYTITNENYAEEVEKSALPVLLDFWAPWCGPCRMLAPIVEALATEYEGRVKVGKVNVDEQGELAQAFHITSIPTLVMIRDGKIETSATGYRSKEELLALFHL